MSSPAPSKEELLDQVNRYLRKASAAANDYIAALQEDFDSVPKTSPGEDTLIFIESVVRHLPEDIHNLDSLHESSRNILSDLLQDAKESPFRVVELVKFGYRPPPAVTKGEEGRQIAQITLPSKDIPRDSKEQYACFDKFTGTHNGVDGDYVLTFIPDSEEYSKLEVEVTGESIVYKTISQREREPSGSGASPSVSVLTRKDKGKGKAKETNDGPEAEGTYSRVINYADFLSPEPRTPSPTVSPIVEGLGPAASPPPSTPQGKQPPSRIPGSLPTWAVLDEESASTRPGHLLQLPEGRGDAEVKVEEVEVQPLRRSTRNAIRAAQTPAPVASSSRLTSLPPPRPIPTRTYKRKTTNLDTVDEDGPSGPTVNAPVAGTRFSKRLQAPPAPKAPERVRAPTRVTKAKVPKVEVDEYELPQLIPPARRGGKRRRADEDEAETEGGAGASGSRPTKKAKTTTKKAPAKTRSKSKK